MNAGLGEGVLEGQAAILELGLSFPGYDGSGVNARGT
jgi:hypothetical protein